MRDSALKPVTRMPASQWAALRRRRAHARQRFETRRAAAPAASRAAWVGEELMRDSALKLNFFILSPY